VLFGANPTGSLTDYYDEVSYGNITVTGTVFNWTTLPSNDTVYEGGNNGLPPGGQTGQLIEDALDDVDGGIDFGQFDNDGPDGTPNSGDDDGFVDFVAFVHPEIGGECGGTGIWSHRWNYRFWANSGGSPYTTDDTRSGGGFIQIDDYVVQPALNCSGGTIEIGVFAHEFGHAFGIPDLYDTDPAPNDSEGLGHWSLMASGNWNTPSRPAHWDAWSKSQLGWLTPTLLTSQSLGQAIDRVEDNPTAIQVVTGNGKYFLIENRQVFGFDQNLPSCGLLIYDVDESIVASRRQSNQVNAVQNCGAFQQNAPDHAGIALEQADGLCQLEGNVNRGDAGDAFPGSTNNQTFDSASDPSVVDYFGADPQVSVTNISACAATMTADIQGFPLPDFTPGAVDVVFLIDNTGSYIDDLPNIQAQMPDIVARLSGAFPDIRFGLATFRDFPFAPFGEVGDLAYDPILPLQSSGPALVTAVTALVAGGGNDEPESQYEAIFQVLDGSGRDLTGDGDTDDTGEVGASDIGWMAGRSRVLYLLTDAPFHDSDTETYPGTTLAAAGRSDVLPLLQPNDPVIFTMVSENPSVIVTQGETGGFPPLPLSALAKQAQELASETLGGVFSVGADSSDLSAAIDVTVEALEEGLELLARMSIDIRPGSDDNPINVTSRGLIPVAILGSATLDVFDLDVTTLRFGPGEASPAHDLSKLGVFLDHLEDVNLDGHVDLVTHYRTRSTEIAAGDTEACVVAELLDDTLIVGCDTIRTVPSGVAGGS
jgi:M6 family metalloprotease-like protein